MPRDALTGRLVIPLIETLDRALSESPVNLVFVRCLYPSLDYAAMNDLEGYVDYERVRDICALADPDWPDSEEKTYYAFSRDQRDD